MIRRRVRRVESTRECVRCVDWERKKEADAMVCRDAVAAMGGGEGAARSVLAPPNAASRGQRQGPALRRGAAHAATSAPV